MSSVPQVAGITDLRGHAHAWTPPGTAKVIRSIFAVWLVAMAMFVGEAGAVSDDKKAWWKRPLSEDELYEVLKLVWMGVQVNQSPIMRQIACRVADEPFSRKALLVALKVPLTDLDSALASLRQMKLITTKGGKIQPASKDAQVRLKRWSADWCLRDDECGVAR